MTMAAGTMNMSMRNFFRRCGPYTQHFDLVVKGTPCIRVVGIQIDIKLADFDNQCIFCPFIGFNRHNSAWNQ